MIFSIATTGLQDMRLPQWGRSFWQDPNDDELFLAYASGTTEVDFITSTDNGFSWSVPALLFPVEDFDIHNNFDTTMDRDGHIHCGFRFNGSGCYQFVGKLPGGGWTLTSGIGPVGLVAAGDSGNLAKGFQGSLTMQETAGAVEVGGIQFPAVMMAAKDDNDNIAAFILGTPYNVSPSIDLISGSPNAGVEGGFPIIFVPDDETNIVYYDEPNNSLDRQEKSFGTYFQFQSLALGNAPGNVDVPFGPSMAIGSGIGLGGNTGIVFVCSSGQLGVGQGLYASSSSSTYQNVFDISNGTERSWLAVESGTLNGQSVGLLVSSGVIPTGLIYGVGPNLFSPEGVTIHNFPGEGTVCDFSFNDDGETLFYFQSKNEWGRQSIGRFKSSFESESWTFPLMDHPESGLKHTASVSQTTAGGFSNILFWGGFKALKHPTEPSASGTKKELIVTQGHVSAFPSGGILTVWNIAESPALGTWSESEWSLDYTVTSGTAHEVFVGINEIANFQFTSHIDRLPFMFDDSFEIAAEYGLIRDGYLIGLELDKERTIDRFEILHRNLIPTPAPGVALSGSMDGINWTRVLHIPSGVISGQGYNDGNSLIKYMARDQTITEVKNSRPPSITGRVQPINVMDPFVAKFVRLQFENTHKGSHRVYEIKLFGPASTNPEIVTWSNADIDPPPYDRLFLTGSREKLTQRFGQQQGTIPNGWRTFGDFEWAVVASGEATKTKSFKPTGPLPVDFDGTVQSGIWSLVRPQRGVFDGFSLRSEAIGDASGLGNPLRGIPIGGIQPGHSGVIEVDIGIIESETIDGQSLPGRNVGFSIRADIHAFDTVEFFIDDVLQQTYGDIGWTSLQGLAGNFELYVEPESFGVVGGGNHTLKWVYTKGIYDIPAPLILYPYGAVWIDNVFGLDAGPLEGAPRNSRHGFLRGVNPFEISSIHAYVSGIDRTSSSINAYATGSPSITDIRKGFLQSRAGLGDQFIHGFASSGVGFESSEIHGFMIAKPTIDPTGVNSSIHGVMNPGSGSITSEILGFLQSRFGIGDQIIHGYIAVESGTFISVTRKGYIPGWDGGVFGLGPNQSAIYGFLNTPIDSGTSSIHGYLMGNFPIESIHGYLGSEALVASGGGLVGNPSTSNVIPGVNFIHGYMKGFQGGQMIHGYLKRPLATFSSIHGYVLSGGIDTQIHGFLDASDETPSDIHGYASGIGFESSSINGYVFGISGIISEEIHGYMTATELPNSEILGIMIGTISGIDSASICFSHSFPLCPLPLFTLPSGFIN